MSFAEPFQSKGHRYMLQAPLPKHPIPKVTALGCKRIRQTTLVLNPNH